MTRGERWRSGALARKARRGSGAAAVAAVLAALALARGACGDDDAGGSAGGGTLTVSAAASLKTALTEYGDAFDSARVRFSFAGSDELAAQIRQGVKPDVFAAANTKLPEQLHAEGLVERPVVFARNKLVLAVPRDSDIERLDDLQRNNEVKLAIGAESVPIGDYTRAVLGRLGTQQREAILQNVRSNEPDVSGIVGKLTQGAADAGFVYATDVVATNGDLKAIELPADLQPEIEYGAAVVKKAKNPAQAAKFIDGLKTAEALRQAGFLPPR